MSGRSPRGLYGEQLDLATPRQWHELVPAEILGEVAAQHGGDQHNGKLPAPVHFWVLLVGVLSKGCSSLKDLISTTQARFGKLLGWLPGDPDKPWVSPAALSQRNASRPVGFWRGLYDRLRGHHFGSRWLRRLWQKKFASIEAIDSSTFRLVARLRHVFAPAGSGGPKKGSKNRKAALKIHQVYNVGSEVPAGLGIGPAREHDRKAVGKALSRAAKGVLYLLDRGYCCFKLWWDIELAEAYFITPLKAGLGYEHLRWLNPRRQRDRVRDELVIFPGMSRGEDWVILRVVSIRQEDGNWWSYVTNLINEEDLSPEDIAELYSLRWRIELFFRHLKHTLNMGHWFAESENGVQAQLYAALMGYLLSQVVLLWASKGAGIAPEQYRFATVVHELATWLSTQLNSAELLPLAQLIERIRRNALDKDKRRNSQVLNPLPG